MKFIKEITPKGLLLPVTAAWLAGLGPGEKVEYRVQKGAMVVLKGRMTAMELLTAARTLHDLSVELNSHLAKVCGQCDGCGGDGEDGEPAVPWWIWMMRTSLCRTICAMRRVSRRASSCALRWMRRKTLSRFSPPVMITICGTFPRRFWRCSSPPTSVWASWRSG